MITLVSGKEEDCFVVVHFSADFSFISAAFRLKLRLRQDDMLPYASCIHSLKKSQFETKRVNDKYTTTSSLPLCRSLALQVV